MNTKLISATVKNFRGLDNINLKFKDLTILVGPNASGKSNTLEALWFIRNLLKTDALPPAEVMQDLVRYGADEAMQFYISTANTKKAEYSFSLTTGQEATKVEHENLKVNEIQVIEVREGRGLVRDEDGKNSQKYHSDSDNLALSSAGNFGEKPITLELANFIKKWEFYDLDTDLIRNAGFLPTLFRNKGSKGKLGTTIGFSGRHIQRILQNWARSNEQAEKEKLENLNEKLSDILDIKLKLAPDQEDRITVIEAGGAKVPFYLMSDGNLRMIAYCMLLTQSDLPPLITIEEPERNFHPGLLKNIASIIKKLSKETQVVITSHSSQLLDCFSVEDIMTDTSVVLVNKTKDLKTKACLLEDLAEKKEEVFDWMSDFGLGSAIYHSNLLKEILDI